MLELRKGKSTKSYENDFFRLLATGLTAEFDKRGWNGLLMGMPESQVLEALQIDCLLVTDSQIILIDFKNYSGDLELPEAERFDYGRWLINGEIAVKGGSSSNPYKQLGKQRAKLSRVLERTMRTSFDKSTIFTLVCFHGQINLIGEVPRRILGFGIADSVTVINKIVDIIDVETGNRQYLKAANKNLFAEKLFSAPEYELSITIDATPKEASDEDSIVAVTVMGGESKKDHADAKQPTAEGDGLYDSHIRNFLESEDRVLIVSGNVRSGKTALIPRIREIAFDLGYIEVPVFAYSNRLKKRMLKNHPEIEEVDSLYGELFDFGNEDVDENYKKTIPVKTHTKSEDEYSGLGVYQGSDLYIIDDSQLISNSDFNSETLQFGTGCLLDDLFAYLQLTEYAHRKVVFIGDVNRISYGSKVENAMNEDYLASYLENKGVSSKVHSMELPSQTDASEIIRVCNNIAENIAQEKYNELIITNANDVSVEGTANQTAILEATFKDSAHNKILVYTNEQANQINFWIKKQLAKNSSCIGTGDYIVFNSTVTAYAPSSISNESTPFVDNEQPFNFDEPKRIDNGSFATVISAEPDHIITMTRTIREVAVSLSFVPCQVRLSDASILQIYVFDNYLRANKTELETSENIAYQVILTSLLKDFMEKHPFEGSDEFKKMEERDRISQEETGAQYYRITENNEYRLVEDGRSLPDEVKEFRRRIENKLLMDPTSDYFKICNAARVKYAWAMTVNKAMADSYDNVYFNTSQGENHGRTNKDYFKWLYTGFATAESRIELINWKPISPFMNTDFNAASNGSVPKPKHFIFTFSNNDETREAEFESFIIKSLAQTGWRLADISPRPYLEIVKLQKNKTALELFFDYNGKGEVKPPRLKSGNNEDMKEILKAIESSTSDEGESESIESGGMESYFDVVIGLLKSRKIEAAVVVAQQWTLVFDFSRAEEKVKVQCWYDSRGMISKFNCIEGSTELFGEIVKIIKETYALDG